MSNPLGLGRATLAATVANHTVDEGGQPGQPMAGSAADLGQPPWTSDPVWTAKVAALADFPPGFSVLELCAGAGTACIALKLLLGQGKARLAGAWDFSAGLEPIYSHVHPGAGASIHLGPRHGDIMKTDLRDFPCANAVVCGPPCPPFSACGSRLALGDCRARPFERCMEIIADLDKRNTGDDLGGIQQPKLMFFMIENVEGIMHRPSSGAQPPLDILSGTLRTLMGPTWVVQAVRVNSLTFGLPQSRGRVYVVGRKSMYYPVRLPRQPTQFARQVTPAELLDLADRTPDPLTARQAECMAAYKALYRESLDSHDFRGKFAFVELGRDPTGATRWGGNAARIDRCQCLRASGPMMRVFALGEGQHPRFDRNLRVRERAALQGFPTSVANLILDERIGKRVFGNAMSVPVVGSLLASELECILDTLRPSALAAALGTQMGTGASAPSQPQKRSSPGPLTLLDMRPVEVDDEGDVLPGLRSSLKAWAANISAHWERGSPGRAARPAAALTPGDHMAMAKRQCLHRRHLGHPQQHVEQIGASSSQGQGQMRSTHGQPWPDNAAWPLEPDEPLADHPGQGENHMHQCQCSRRQVVQLQGQPVRPPIPQPPRAVRQMHPRLQPQRRNAHQERNLRTGHLRATSEGGR